MLPLTAIDEILRKFPSHVLISLPALGNEELQIDAGPLRAQVRMQDELPVFVVMERTDGKLVTWGEACSQTDALTGALEAINVVLQRRDRAA